MPLQDLELIAGAIARTRMASGIEGSSAVKAGKAAALRLVTIDLAATMAHRDPLFDKGSFFKACGFNA